MSGNEKNKKIVENIIKAYTDNNLREFINYVDNDIEWNIVGMPIIKGKNEFLNAVCSLELKNFSSSTIKNIISEGEFVVVESTVTREEKLDKTKFLAYCDIYTIKNNKINKLTSYLVDTSTNIDKSITGYNS